MFEALWRPHAGWFPAVNQMSSQAFHYLAQSAYPKHAAGLGFGPGMTKTGHGYFFQRFLK